MKKILFILVLLVTTSYVSAQAQVTKNSKGEFVNLEVTKKAGTKAEKTVNIYRDKNGKTYEVYKSKNGKMFIKKVSAKTGKEYNYYIEEVSNGK